MYLYDRYLAWRSGREESALEDEIAVELEVEGHGENEIQAALYAREVDIAESDSDDWGPPDWEPPKRRDRDEPNGTDPDFAGDETFADDAQ